jgi:hypothetical protein
LISIPLSSAGVSYLNGFLGGPVLLGGTVPSIVAPAGTPQQPFGFTSPMIPGMGPSVPKLDLIVIPEPASGLLIVVAAGAIIRRGAVSSRRRVLRE